MTGLSFLLLQAEFKCVLTVKASQVNMDRGSNVQYLQWKNSQVNMDREGFISEYKEIQWTG